MNSLLKQISKKAIELADFEFAQGQTDNKWLGTKPASEKEIKLTEKNSELIYQPILNCFYQLQTDFLHQTISNRLLSRLTKLTF